ncbi:RipA family octameric membrane protein [Brevibacillus laterosporus]|uniref:RipA family octameric membrane protein n=1 Tax=Brevibacillus laterosporus TaxID=1465 RepID=UPI003CC7EFC7
MEYSEKHGEKQDEEYGEKYKDHLLDQYKLYVQMADNISTRRDSTNKFYLSVLSALLAIIPIVKSALADAVETAFLIISLLGIFLCIIWYINIRSYKQLNSAKFKVIHQLEEELPFSCFKVEWDKIKNAQQKDRYFRLTQIESKVPIIILIVYVVLLLYSLWSIFKCTCNT